MDLKTITATLALLGGLSACGGEAKDAKKDAKEVTPAKTDAKPEAAKPADAKPADAKTDAKPADAKAGEMACGEGKCGAGSCGAKKPADAKAGEMACGEGKCGAGSCGAHKDKPADGKAIPVDAKPTDAKAAAKPEDGKKS